MSEALYPNLGLYRNPFIVSVERDVRRIEEIIEDVSRFCIDIRNKEYGQIRKRFLLPLLNPSEGQVPENLWVKGEKGVGKSILLKKLAYDLYGKPDIVTLYVKVPESGLDINGIYQRSVEWLGQGTFEKLALRIYEKFFEKIDLNTAAKILKVPQDQLEQFTNNLKELIAKQPEIIFKFFSKNPQTIQELQDLGIAPGMVKLNALTYQMSVNCVANYNIHKKFADLISALPENPAESYAEILNISKKETVPVFLAIQRAFATFLGTRAIVIILDEFEIAWRKMTDAGRLTTVVAIRALHDSSQGNIKFIVTVTDDVFETLPQEKYRHVLDVIPKTTIGKNVIDVTHLDQSQAIRLVEFLLNQEGVRLGDAKFIHPFVPEVIIAVNNKVGGVTRDLVTELRDIVNEAEEKGMKIIDVDNLLKMSSEYEPYIPH